METLFQKSEKRIANKAKKQSIPDVICKNVDSQELKTKIENKIKYLFLRSMSAKHEKSVTYINKAIAGELPTMKIANRVRVDYIEYQRCINSFVTLLEN